MDYVKAVACGFKGTELEYKEMLASNPVQNMVLANMRATLDIVLQHGYLVMLGGLMPVLDRETSESAESFRFSVAFSNEHGHFFDFTRTGRRGSKLSHTVRFQVDANFIVQHAESAWFGDKGAGWMMSTQLAFQYYMMEIMDRYETDGSLKPGKTVPTELVVRNLPL
jgi:hypothetical protein